MKSMDSHFTSDDILKSLFDPVLRSEVNAYAKENGWDSVAPLDLSKVPREQWDDCIAFPLAWPPNIQLYMDATKGDVITTSEIDSIEESMDAFYGVTAPYTILLDRISKTATLAKM